MLYTVYTIQHFNACNPPILTLFTLKGTVVKNIMQYIDKCKVHKERLLEIAVGIIICVCQFFSLEFSAMDVSEWSFIHSEILSLTNFAIVTLFNIILIIIFQNPAISFAITSIICAIWSIANYYVILFHGAPLSVSTLLNFKTAMDVLNGYRFNLSGKVLCLFAVFGVELIAVWILKKYGKEKKFSFERILFEVVVLSANIVFLYAFLFSSHAIKPQKTIGWSWKDSAQRYGYLCYLVEDTRNTLYPVKEPEGYSVDLLFDLEIPEIQNTDEKPDIILILNESFFDFDVYTDIKADTDYLSQFYGLEGAIYGHAVSPMVGGGTNNSEYELLTSNSMYLLNADAPFNYLDLEKGENLIRLLSSIGYETCGMHCATPTNYSRDKAYPALGFDHVILGKTQFETLQYYGDRPWLDSDNYQDMINIFEGLGEGPRFIYLLTYQNHGGYEQNSSTFDKIHTKVDFGELTDDVNEYLTSVQMSAEAFHSLTDYFSKSDRPTIICMLGDHAPSFIANIPSSETLSEEELEIVLRSVPYVIWANYDLNTVGKTEDYISMVDFAPLIMKSAGLPLTAYYKTILDLHERIPVRTSFGPYMGRDGVIERFDFGEKTCKEIMQYYYLEYNALNGGKEYQEQYFKLQGIE